jgi:hypothetical protein
MTFGLGIAFILALCVFGLVVLLAVKVGRPPREIVGVDAIAKMACELLIQPPVPARLRLWGRYELQTDDEDAEVEVEYALFSNGKRLFDGKFQRATSRYWHGGRANWKSFTDPIATFSELDASQPIMIRCTIRSAVPILRARIYVSR